MKVQKEHKKKTFLNYTKDELADLCMTLEHNFNVISERFDNQYSYCIKLIDDMSLVNKTYSEAKEIINQGAIKPQTNFDKITSSVESLAKYINETNDFCPFGYKDIIPCHKQGCEECIKEWLQQECK